MNILQKQFNEVKNKNKYKYSAMETKPKMMFNINCDTKRIWSSDFKNCSEVLKKVIDSAPIFVNMLK